MIEPDSIIRFAPSDARTDLPESADTEPTEVPSADVLQPPPLQTPEPKEWRPLGAEW